MKLVLNVLSFRRRSGRPTCWVTNVVLNVAAYAISLAGVLIGHSDAAPRFWTVTSC